RPPHWLNDRSALRFTHCAAKRRATPLCGQTAGGTFSIPSPLHVEAWWPHGPSGGGGMPICPGIAWDHYSPVGSDLLFTRTRVPGSNGTLRVRRRASTDESSVGSNTRGAGGVAIATPAIDAHLRRRCHTRSWSTITRTR